MGGFNPAEYPVHALERVADKLDAAMEHIAHMEVARIGPDSQIGTMGYHREAAKEYIKKAWEIAESWRRTPSPTHPTPTADPAGEGVDG